MKEENETPQDKVDALGAQTEEKNANKEQSLENKEVEAKELKEEQLDEVAAGGRVFSWKEPVVM